MSPHRVSLPVRLLAAIPLVFLIGLACFGFLAADEIPEWPQRLPWQVGYAGFGAACVAGVVALLRKRRGPKKCDARELRRPRR